MPQEDFKKGMTAIFPVRI